MTTVTFEGTDGRTRVVSRETYPSKEALDAAAGAVDAATEQFDQLEDVLARLGEAQAT